MNANEFVARGCYVEIRLLLVYKEGVRYPYVSNKFRTHGECFNTSPFFISKSGVGPKLPEVEIQGEVLKHFFNYRKQYQLSVDSYPIQQCMWFSSRTRFLGPSFTLKCIVILWIQATIRYNRSRCTVCALGTSLKYQHTNLNCPSYVWINLNFWIGGYSPCIFLFKSISLSINSNI